MNRPGELTLDQLLAPLQGSDVAKVTEAVWMIGMRLPVLGAADVRRAVEGLCDLFYIDLSDRPEFGPALEAAEKALVALGEPVIPTLIHLMEGSDIKCHLHLATVMGRIGLPALASLRRLVATAEDPYSRSFALYAIGRIRSPEIHEALPEAVGALMHPDKEVRDSAARTLGKIVEAVDPARLTERRRSEIYEALCRALSDPQAAVRAKAVRSLGKMAGRSYLAAEQVGDLRLKLQALLERGEETDWDHAYIVRRQAQEALTLLADRQRASS
jgi:HEAT repeat protein